MRRLDSILLAGRDGRRHLAKNAEFLQGFQATGDRVEALAEFFGRAAEGEAEVGRGVEEGAGDNGDTMLREEAVGEGDGRAGSDTFEVSPAGEESLHESRVDPDELMSAGIEPVQIAKGNDRQSVGGHRAPDVHDVAGAADAPRDLG